MTREMAIADAAVSGGQEEGLHPLSLFFQSSGVSLASGVQVIVVKDSSSSSYAFSILARESFKEGCCIGSIPKDVILSRQTSAISDVIESSSSFSSDPHHLPLPLAVALMYELVNLSTSPWRDYLTLIAGQSALSTLPLFWTTSELDHLDGTDLNRSMLEQYKSHLHSAYHSQLVPFFHQHQDIFGHVDQEPSYSYSLFLQAIALISSRAFYIDAYHGDAMVPLADLFNHKTNGEHIHIQSEDVCGHCGGLGCLCADVDELLHASTGLASSKGDQDSNDEEDWEDDESETSSSPPSELDDPQDWTGAQGDVLELRVVSFIHAGEEVFNTYGPLPNTALLQKYGFTEPNNPYDDVSIAKEDVLSCLLERCPGKDLAALCEFYDTFIGPAILAEIEGDNEEEQEGIDGESKSSNDYVHAFYFDAQGMASPTLVAFLLAIFADAKTAAKIKKSPEFAINFTTSYLSKKKVASGHKAPHPATLAIQKTLRELATRRLAKYPTTLEADQIVLKSLEASSSGSLLKWSLILRISEKKILTKAIKKA